MKHLITTRSVLWVRLFCLCLPGQAQDDNDLRVSFEEIQKKCKDRPSAERILVAVTRFSLATGYRSTEGRACASCSNFLVNHVGFWGWAGGIFRRPSALVPFPTFNKVLSWIFSVSYSRMLLIK